jgi:hypothetical protein
LDKAASWECGRIPKKLTYDHADPERLLFRAPG